MGDVSEETLLNYIYSLGGKVRNADILKKYKPFISHNDLQLRAKYREEFKAIIDRIAVVKSENGEKYLVLKKRYRQQLQDRDRSDQTLPACTSLLSEGAGSSPIPHSQDDQHSLATDVDGNCSESEEREKGGSRTVVWDGPTITITESLSRLADQQDVKADSDVLSLREVSTLSSEDTPEPTDAEDEVEKESKSDHELNQEEECAGDSVALDPVEKDWLYSAACAQLSHLTQLLEQEPALANKKDFTSGFTALHWAAKHGKEDMTRAMANAGADINSRAHGGYTPLHIAALHGHRHVMDLLVGTYGAKDNLRDYSGHFAYYYISPRDPAEEDSELHGPEYHAVQVSERKNRKLASLFHSKKKWGSAEELAAIPEERNTSHQLMVPAFRPRKFSR
ncbi:ankyrin repeat domain-containing protein SOWAHA isoform X1 [Alosa sapidissima]|uniref:ankyrin repeat domain-containing protein SOWAHA isoform X1 n=1 Tax=Alosa sapidissima TaxID=34773 RepID=UPI001C096F6F|nr:ankyrin repeat domain-containing protein SOWAHA isoform X1 [Alosa sapidissima]